MLSVLLVSLAAGQSVEWSGVFATPDASYTWIAQKTGTGTKDYVDPNMKFMAVAVTTATDAELETLEGSTNTLMAGTCTDVAASATITPSATTCYRLVFDANSAETTFTVDASGATNIAFFGQHHPIEFEDTKHYFQTTAGVDVEPAAEHTPASFEWVGIFATPDASYTWIAQKKTQTDGTVGYTDDDMVLVALPATAATDAAMDALKPEGKKAFVGLSAATCTDVNKGETITPALNTCFKLIFDKGVAETTFVVDASGATNIAFFGQHHPIEFEDNKHYFQTSAGADVEPAADETVSGEEHAHSHGAGSIDHGLDCACEQTGDHPFVIDCTKTQVIRDAMTTMGTCDKDTCKTTPECQTAYFVLQAHHDHCDHDTLHYEEEIAVHDFEMKCTNCRIYRKYKKDNVDCHFMPAESETYCADPAPTVDALSQLETLCEKYVDADTPGKCCESPATIGAFATIVAYHDLCDPQDVPEAVEKAFHDYEHQCADHICNAVASDYDGTKCDSVDGGAALFGLLAAAVLAA